MALGEHGPVECDDVSDGEGPPPLESAYSTDEAVRLGFIKKLCAKLTCIQDTYSNGGTLAGSEAVSGTSAVTVSRMLT